MARADRSLRFLLAIVVVMLGFVTGKESVPRSINLVAQNIHDSPTTLNGLIQNELFEKQRGSAPLLGRTFGHKRIQFMMMPMIYKMGVMMTMIGVLTVISLKGLLIGAMLLILKLSMIFGKLFSNIHEHSSNSWISHQQPIHLHLHNAGPYEVYGQTNGGWEAGGSNPHESYFYKG